MRGACSAPMTAVAGAPAHALRLMSNSCITTGRNERFSMGISAPNGGWPRPGARSGATGSRLAAMDFAAQSCEFCVRACDAAMAYLHEDSGPACAPSLLEALGSCRRLVHLNTELLRGRSPLYPLMSAACVAACALVCKASELMRRSRDDDGEFEPLLKEVGDTCWIAAHACRDVVSVEPRSARPL